MPVYSQTAVKTSVLSSFIAQMWTITAEDY